MRFIKHQNINGTIRKMEINMAVVVTARVN